MSSHPRLQRRLRAWGFDRNPMRRRVDRVETWTATVLLVLLLVVVPIAAVVTMARVYDNGVRAEHHQAATRFRVTATVLTNGELTADSSGNGVGQVVTVGWHTRWGAYQRAAVPEMPGDRIGAHRRLWVTASGAVVGRPRDRAQTVSDTVLAGLFAITGATLPFVGVHSLVRRRLDRKRMAAWEADWALTAPRWIRNA